MGYGINNRDNVIEIELRDCTDGSIARFKAEVMDSPIFRFEVDMSLLGIIVYKRIPLYLFSPRFFCNSFQSSLRKFLKCVSFSQW